MQNSNMIQKQASVVSFVYLLTMSGTCANMFTVRSPACLSRIAACHWLQESSVFTRC